MDVTIKILEPRRVAFVRHQGAYSECGAAWDRLCTYLGVEGFLGAGTDLIGLCHDDPAITAAERIRYDACAAVDASFEPTEDIGVQVLAGGDYAVTTHFGSYEGLAAAYASFLGGWLPRSGRELRGAPCLEHYLTDPESTDPEDYVTDLYAPLEPA